MAKGLLKRHFYCPIVLIQTTKTPVHLQTNAIFQLIYVF